MLSKIKKIFLISLIITSLFSICLKTPNLAISAEKSENLTLSDIVYADLAVHNHLDKVSMNYFDGSSDNNITINSDKPWIPASTIKIYAAMYVYDQVANGKLALDNLFTIDANNVAPSEQVQDGFPELQVGETVTLSRLIQQMIEQSDNTAFNTLLDILDRKEISKYIHDLGLINSNVGAKLNLDDSQQQLEYGVPGYGSNTTTSNDYQTAFILINGNRIPGSSGLFNILSQQKFNNMIPLLLPKDTLVAHKTGDLDPLYHDGGIVVAPSKRYVLSIFTNAGDPNIVAHISQLVYTKDYSLIGLDVKTKSVSDANYLENPPLDPLLTQNNDINNSVLAAQSETKVVAPHITASDLGIKLSDVSLALPATQLPRVLIPADSKFYFLVNAWRNVTNALTIGKTAKTSFEVQRLKFELAEARDLSKRGKREEALNLLQEVDQSLGVVAKAAPVDASQSLQTSIQEISQTRFSLLQDELKLVDENEKVQLIKKIAEQARNALRNVEPNVPKAVTATSINQEPVIGQIVNVTNSVVTIKTATGENISVPVRAEIKVREKGQTETKMESLATVPIGTTIALVGTSGIQKGSFNPTFALTKLPARFAAPVPATVVRVNKENKTIVISQNGTPAQIDVAQTTKIKGPDTGVGLNDIKPGDVITFHNEETVPSGVPPSSSQTKTTITTATTPPGGVNKPAPSSSTPTEKKQPEVFKSTVIEVVGKSKKQAPKPETPHPEITAPPKSTATPASPPPSGNTK